MANLVRTPAQFDDIPKVFDLDADEQETGDTARTDDPMSTLLLAVGKQRNRQAFGALFRHFAPRLKSYIMRGGADTAAAEETVQETMLTVWRRAETFDPTRSSAATWIFTIARNKRIDSLRRERRYDPAPEPEENCELDPDPTPAEMVEKSQAYRQLTRGIDGLPRNQADVIRMAFLEDRSHASIAQSLDLPIGTVKSRIRLGLDKMRSMMTGAGQ